MMVAPLISACNSDDEPKATGTDTGTDTSTDTSGTNNGGTCTTTPSETAGPYPTKNPSGLVLEDIRSDRQGVLMNVEITIKNKNASCAALAGAMVDIWHCDKDGNYSEYGSSTSVHFLRGRQTTDSNGQVGFVSIFPGWYSGRAPHIHVHIYNSSGASLLVTQIAFPKTTCDTVYTTSSYYSSRGTADTTNERDNVFSDGYTNELAVLTGDISNGYTLTHTIVVEA